MADFTFSFQLVENGKDTSVTHNFNRRTVDLVEVNRFSLQAAQTLLTVLANPPCRVVLRIVNITGTAKFRSDMYIILFAFGGFGE
ncbi:hypothetical protein D3C81_1814020 [compost metagenome]